MAQAIITKDDIIGLGESAFRTISVSDTMLITDDIIECTATLTLTLLTAVGIVGKTVIVKNSSTSSIVTLDGFSTETIEGELTQTIAGGDSYTLVSNGTNWILI